MLEQWDDELTTEPYDGPITELGGYPLIAYSIVAGRLAAPRTADRGAVDEDGEVALAVGRCDLACEFVAPLPAIGIDQ